MRYSRLVAGSLLLALASAGSGAELTLIDNGQSRTSIHVAPRVMAEDDKKVLQGKSPEQEAEKQRQRLRESVRDLARYLEKMAGAKVEVSTSPPPANAAVVPILVGEMAQQTFGPPGKKAPFKQGFRMVVSAKGVGLLGESDLAASYAVYELLDRLGCRWYMPGELGEVIPALKTIKLAEVDFSSAPGTIYRGVWYADDAYKRRNRHGGLLLSAGHALEMYLSKEDRQKHPEWRAEVGGKPDPHRLKWSQPGVADAIAGKVLATLDTSAPPSVSLSPDDGLGFDESAQDKALDAGDFDPTFSGISLTDRLLVLCNRIATKVSAKHPDTLFGLLAYANYTRPPVREKVHPNIVPQIAPITYSRGHPMTDPRVPGNRELRSLIEGWGKAAKMTSVYFYAYNLAETTAPQPMLTKWSVDVPFVLKHGCQFWQPETLANFETHMHALYLGCRLAWDPTQKPEAIIEEINTRFYGSAARQMAAYWWYVDSVWVQTPECSGCGFGYLRRWTPERLKRARQLLDEALAACKSPIEKQRVQLADDSLRLFETFMQLRRDQAEGRFANLGKDADAWRKRVVELAEKYKDSFCFSKAAWSQPTVGGGYFAQFYQQTYDDAARISKEFEILTPRPLRSFRYRADPERRGETLGWHKPDLDDSSWETTDVCLETWSSLGYHDYFESMWYRAALPLPVAKTGKKTFLWIGATDGSVKVFVNGKHIPHLDKKNQAQDEFNGYCQPVSFDISMALRADGPNQIALLCKRTFFNELGTGGLIAPVAVYREK